MNRNSNNANDDLLVKYMLGEATGAEQKEVQDWMAADPNNQKYFEDFKLIWDQSKDLAGTSDIDENEAWQRFTQRVAKEEADAPSTRIIPLQRTNWMRAAAILLILAIAGGIANYLTGNTGMEMRTARSGATPVTDTLPDGSIIVLNKNSTLTYPSKFTGSTRKVTLEGEAFFSVVHNKAQPFIIDANNAAITVVGTTFNVKTTAAKTEVIVETGIVEVAKKQNAIRVIHNQKAIVTYEKPAPEMERNTDMLYNYYRTKEFVCDGTPLWKLVETLNEAFDVHISIANTAARNLPLTVTFRDEPEDEMLKVVCATLNLQQEKKGNTIILK